MPDRSKPIFDVNFEAKVSKLHNVKLSAVVGDDHSWKIKSTNDRLPNKVFDFCLMIYAKGSAFTHFVK